MFIKTLLYQKKWFITLVLIGAFLVGCSPQENQTPVISSQMAETKQVTPTLAEVSTSTPTLQPGTVILIAPDAADPDQVTSVNDVLGPLTAEAGLDLQVKTSLTNAELNSSVKIVIGLAPDIGLANLAASFPEIQFVGIGMDGLQTTSNLSVITSQDSLSSRQAFMAGYIAALLSYDWRVGILTSATAADTQNNAAVFSNGARFFCGLCRPVHPPYLSYPQSAEIASPESQDSWRSAADLLLESDIDYMYIDPKVSSTDLLEYLFQSNVNLIGSQTPPDSVSSRWVATILPDPGSALKAIWPDILTGKGGTLVDLPLVVTDTSSGLLNTARMRLVDLTLANLMAGLIDPNS
jgi:hypothetical protein